MRIVSKQWKLFVCSPYHRRAILLGILPVHSRLKRKTAHSFYKWSRTCYSFDDTKIVSFRQCSDF
ncbi:hypothetical protein HZS_3053 [Henneguya salminicola]|nr:hypothetical protein HZS_3053 [Henneguya salminicola]